jgi:hypothetical protein
MVMMSYPVSLTLARPPFWGSEPRRRLSGDPGVSHEAELETEGQQIKTPLSFLQELELVGQCSLGVLWGGASSGCAGQAWDPSLLSWEQQGVRRGPQAQGEPLRASLREPRAV